MMPVHVWVVVWLLAAKLHTPTTQDTLGRIPFKGSARLSTSTLILARGGPTVKFGALSTVYVRTCPDTLSGHSVVRTAHRVRTLCLAALVAFEGRWATLAG